MSKRKSSVPSDYSVGYGRPPKETQFTPGKSGNPNGRRKDSRSVGAMLRDMIEQKISVTENGKTRRMPALEVMLRRLVNDSIRGDGKAMKMLLSFVNRYAETAESKIQLGELLAEDREILARYLPEQTPPIERDNGGQGDAD